MAQTPGGRRRNGCSSLPHLADTHGVPHERLVIGVQKAGAEIGSAAAVDDGGADDVLPLLQREAFGDAVVDDRLAIAVDADDLLAIHPPDRRGVRSNGQAYA